MHKNNNFDFLRFCAAAFVMFGHSLPLMGAKYPDLFGWPFPIYGVVVFFSISGYLIADSWLNDPSVPRYLAKRALRIFPALAVVVLVSTFVIGPLVSSLVLSDYLKSYQTTFYLRNIALYANYYLPGVFTNNPYASVVNGCLWTLPVEFGMYLITPFALFIKSARAAVLLLIAASFALASVYLAVVHSPQIVFYETDLRSFMAVGCYFLAGALFRVLKHRFTPSLRISAVLIIFIAILAPHFVGWLTFPIYLFSTFAIPYIVLSVAYSEFFPFSNFGKYGDISHGIYLWGFPVQQIVAEHLYGKIGFGVATILSLAMTIPIAWLSWHIVEKRFLLFKPRPRKPLGQFGEPYNLV